MFGIGFGALRQMSETFKYNRDLLSKTKREPFERIDKKSQGRKTLSDDIRKSDADRLNLLASINSYYKWDPNKIRYYFNNLGFGYGRVEMVAASKPFET